MPVFNRLKKLGWREITIQVGLILAVLANQDCSSGLQAVSQENSQSSLGNSSSTTTTPSLKNTVSVASLTANNTTASSAFTDIYTNYVTNTVGTAGKPTTNGDALPINVSGVSVHTLMPNHPNMKIYVETQDWFGHNASNVVNGQLVANALYYQSLDVGYSSSANAAAQVDEMVRRGIDGASVNWYGPGTIGDAAVANMFSHAASAYPGKFEVTVDIDHGAFTETGSPCAGLTPTNMAICFLNYINTNYGSSSAFMMMNGKKVIMWFLLPDDTLNTQIDWPTVKTYATSLNMMMLIENPVVLDSWTFYNDDGFSDGAYAWVTNNGTYSSSNTSAAYSWLADEFFPSVLSNTSKFSVSGAWRGFNDVAASWTSNQLIPTACGSTWLGTFAANDATTANLNAIMIDTWDDYAEGSEIETGIDNCLSSVTGSSSSASLTWTSNFGTDPWSGAQGSEASLDHYEIWLSTDSGSTAAMMYQVVPTGTGSGSVLLSALGVPSGSYLAYVRAVGKASIQNHTSTAISITIP